MAGFDAGTAVDPLDFDFTAYGGPKGTIPEPTEKALEGFIKETRKIASEFGSSKDRESLTPEEMVEEMDRLSSSMPEATSRLADAAAALCSGVPSAAEILVLPMRVRNAFVGWLMGQFRPEA